MVNYKILGYILIGLGLLFLVPVFIFKMQVDTLTNDIMIATGGSCIQDGKCLHEQSDFPIYIGIALIFMMLALGLYLLFFERSREAGEKIHRELIGSLRETKKKHDKDEKFEFLLKALNEDEQKIMKAVKDQDGIEQATLRIRTGMSKTKLSVVLSELEKKGLVSKVPEGKKNKVFLKGAF